MRKFNIVMLFMTILSCSTTAQAHAFLDHAIPGLGSTVATSSGRITLYFTQALEPKFSGGEVHNAAGARVDHGKSVSGNVMRLNVGSLSPGSYSVTWHALSVDTHTTQGSLSFHVGK